jgi:cysteine desulfurase
MISEPFGSRICPKTTEPLGSQIYLDWNSTSPPHPDVLAAMQFAGTNIWANPASVHAWGRKSKNLVENVRDSLAQLIEVHPRDLVFTSGGTEANNWALHNVPGLVLSRIEHPSVTRQGERLEHSGRPVRWLPVPTTGIIEPDSIEQSLAGMPVGSCVAVTAVNHETGIIQPITAISEVVHRLGAILHVDAVQALGKLPADSWNCWDSVAIAAHKFRGPKGIGALAWKGGRRAPAPIFAGGGQERGLRPGTVDPILVAGFGAALDRISDYADSQRRLTALRDRLEAELGALVESNVVAHAPRLGHVSSLYIESWSAEELVAALDLEGICVSSGSACAAGTAEVSPVITAMFDVNRARSTVRISLGETTSESEIQRAIAVFRAVLSRP